MLAAWGLGHHFSAVGRPNPRTRLSPRAALAAAGVAGTQKARGAKDAGGLQAIYSDGSVRNLRSVRNVGRLTVRDRLDAQLFIRL